MLTEVKTPAAGSPRAFRKEKTRLTTVSFHVGGGGADEGQWHWHMRGELPSEHRARCETGAGSMLRQNQCPSSERHRVLQLRALLCPG